MARGIIHRYPQCILKALVTAQEPQNSTVIPFIELVVLMRCLLQDIANELGLASKNWLLSKS